MSGKKQGTKQEMKQKM
jgi:hypothetical protein